MKVCISDQVSSTQALHIYKGTGAPAHTVHCGTWVRAAINSQKKRYTIDAEVFHFASHCKTTFALLWHQQAEDTRLLSLDPHNWSVLYKMDTKPR